jgi:hypothetical protein
MAIFETLRMNNLRMRYRISQDNTKPFTTIYNETLNKSIVVNCNVGDINRGWYSWQYEKMLIQDAFPFLSNDEREFIMTGITPDEWNEMFLNDTDQFEEK